jgi:hypothetical protein
MGAIPKWGWILLLAVSFDDILVWLSSPVLAIPLILIIILSVVFFIYKPSAAGNLMQNAANVTRASLGSLAVKATAGLVASQRASV